jgi:hypothetical protein
MTLKSCFILFAVIAIVWLGATTFQVSATVANAVSLALPASGN